MPGKTTKSEYLIVVAHPDDETIFFSSLLLKYNKKCQVICVTDGNADGFGANRQLQFANACKAFGVGKFECWKFPDLFEQRLLQSDLQNRLASLGIFKKIFTHGILGEYGHPHHQDVSFAVHQIFNKSSEVYSVAYNTFPDLKLSLTSLEFKLKTHVLWKIYEGEIKRFLNFIPATSTEGFVKVSLNEVSEVYSWLSKRNLLNEKKLKKYKWLKDYLIGGGNSLGQRPF